MNIFKIWNDIEDREYFHSFSLTEGSNTENIRNKSKSTGFSKKRLKPNTEYSYVYTVYDVRDREVFSASGTVTTKALPVPSLSVSVSGTSITAQVTIPDNIKSVQLEESIPSDFSRITPATIQRSLASNIGTAETKTIILSNRNPSTTYHFRTASEFLGEQSGYSASESITTGSYLAPYPVGGVRATSPDIGKVRLKWRWGGSYRGETASVHRYRDGVLGNVNLGSFPRSGVAGDLDDREYSVEQIISD